MVKIKNTFIGGKMDQDSDSRLVPESVYTNALNIKVTSASDNDVGAVENALSNRQLTNLALGTNAKTLGMYFDSVDEKIYWFIISDSGSYVLEFEIDTQITTIVLEDTSVGVLNFNEFFLITGVNLTVDSDNDIRLLSWNDNLNPPRQINVERAKSYGANNFNSAQISLIKPPPLPPPSISLSDSGFFGTQNNIEERFIRFSHRYQYLDGEFSALSPFTEVGFLPRTFAYDYSTSSNESMVNNFNQVDIAFNTGSSLVVAIDVVFKDSNSNTVYIIDNFVKTEQGWIDDQQVSIEFINNKIFKALDADQLLRLYDAVPLKAKAQEIIGNRLIFGNYTENYNLEDCEGTQITISFVTTLVTTAIVEGTPTNSLKSNRDYEIGIIYMDEQGRMTTVLTSALNTVFIPNNDCINQNQIKVTVSNKAPCFASKYRFFIKYTRPDYDSITPTVFYNDGIFVWVLLQGNEVNKVTLGEFIYVKSDTQGILSSAVQTRVLEIKSQEVDFLNNAPATQVSGTYMRVKPRGYKLNEEDYEVYEFDSYDNTRNRYDDPLRGLVNVIELASYYGLNGLNDLTQSGTYTGTTDIRYIIEIDGTGAPDTFQWSDDDGATFTTLVAITGAAQTLNNGVQVTFAATTGHLLTDNWIVSAKSNVTNGIGGDENSKAYALFKSLPSDGATDINNINVEDEINGGAQILINYSETGEVSITENSSYISSSRYDNLEEWWFKDNIGDTYFRDATNVWFRRGTVGQTSGAAKFFTQDPTGDMTLIIRSVGTQNNDADNIIKVYSDFTIVSLEQNLIFETIPLNNNAELFQEIGRTYDIDTSRNHLGFDGLDVDQTDIVPAELILPVFNCFSWGNGFESYKIKDLFNAVNFKLDTRPSSTIEDYRENVRIASLTYSKVYEQTTNFNGLNEFNLSTANFKDLDDKFETIQKIYSRDTNLIVFQEDKVHRIPYTKNILFTAAGDVSVTASADILGTEVSYAGEFGISTNPESFAFYGNAIYFTDVRRGAVLRLDLNGIIEISRNGMNDFFEDSFRGLLRTKKIGAFDLFNKQYVLSVDDTPLPTPIPVVNCGADISLFELEAVIIFNLIINASTGPVIINYEIIGTVNLTITENLVVTDLGSLNGTNSVQYVQDSATTELTFTITPISETPTVNLFLPCPIDTIPAVIANDDNYTVQQSAAEDLNVLINDVFTLPVIVTIDTVPTKGTAVVNPDKTIKYTNNGTLGADSFIYKIDDGLTDDTATVSLDVVGQVGTEFEMSVQSSVTSVGACGFTIIAILRVHDGSELFPQVGDFVFTDFAMLNPYNGGNLYYRIDGGFTIQVASDGEVINRPTCP